MVVLLSEATGYRGHLPDLSRLPSKIADLIARPLVIPRKTAPALIPFRPPNWRMWWLPCHFFRLVNSRGSSFNNVIQFVVIDDTCVIEQIGFQTHEPSRHLASDGKDQIDIQVITHTRFGLSWSRTGANSLFEKSSVAAVELNRLTVTGGKFFSTLPCSCGGAGSSCGQRLTIMNDVGPYSMLRAPA